MTDLATEFAGALAYGEFLENHGSEEDRERWRVVRDRVVLTDRQQAVLGSFARDMKVLVLAGAWCGDCVNQCPVFERFSEESPVISVRYLDRDANPELTESLSVNGGHRVPVVVFLSEDDFPCGIFGDRTLAKYRAMAADIDSSLVTLAGNDGRTLLEQATEEWLNEFERMQWMLRTSGSCRSTLVEDPELVA